jgi:hypothetical protein
MQWTNTLAFFTRKSFIEEGEKKFSDIGYWAKVSLRLIQMIIESESLVPSPLAENRLADRHLVDLYYIRKYFLINQMLESELCRPKYYVSQRLLAKFL